MRIRFQRHLIVAHKQSKRRSTFQPNLHSKQQQWLRYSQYLQRIFYYPTCVKYV